MNEQFPAAKPTKPKRRKPAAPKPKTREPSPDEDLYAIRDIVGEKFVKGKLLYKVDWADNPTTGERYDPTWVISDTSSSFPCHPANHFIARLQEPAAHVTEAAVADWEAQKRRRQHSEAQSSKRKREPSVDEEDERASKHQRRSVDSGYTSTDGDLASSWPQSSREQDSWAPAQSIPESKATKIVLDIARPPGFDPSEYLRIYSSQSAPSSQVVDAPVSQGDSSHQAGGRTSQRTIPDSQEYLDSLRTQSTTQSAAFTETQTIRAELDIPSRQPEDLHHHESAHSSGLLVTHQSPQGTSRDSLSPTNRRSGEQVLPSEDSPWGEGFLTQPDYDFPEFSQSGGGLSSNQGVDQDHQEQESGPTNPAPENDFVVSASGSFQNGQAAQKVSLLDSHPGLLTQSSGDIVPETVQRARWRSPSQNHSPGASSPQNKEASHPSTPVPERRTSVASTPQKGNMDGPAEFTPRRSAAEMMRRLTEEVFGASTDAPPAESNQESAPAPAPEPEPTSALVSPSAVFPPMGNFAEHLEASAAPADLSADGPSQHIPGDFHMPPESSTADGHGMDFEQPPATVAPADLTTSVEHFCSAHDDQVLGGVLEEPAPDSASVEPDQYSLDMGTDSQEDHGRLFTVTLPMAANIRAAYLEIISQNKATMINFGDVLSNSDSNPEPALVTKLDGIFKDLLNLCDLPAYHDDLPELGKIEKMKHATNSNSKFSFVYEFLHGLWDINARILVLCQPDVFEYLEAVISTTNCPYSVLAQSGEDSSAQSTEGTSVILAVAGQDLSNVQGIDVVISFDHTARSVELPATLGYGSMAPIVLSLVATYSLDHIDQQLVDQDLDSLERRNALNLASVTALEYLRNPDRQCVEPHEAAKTFANFLRNPENGLDWEPHPLPADVFEIWLSSQTQNSQAQVNQPDMLSGPGSGRKRHLVSTFSSSIAGRSR
jgi:hypothetical protein